MPGHDIIVIGGSAGALQALLRFLPGLPSHLPAALLVVVHTSPRERSRLAQVLHRACHIPAAVAEDGMAIHHNRIIVAPPDNHLLVHNHSLRLTQGAKEHFTRPAIDPLFRTAAAHYGPRVVGVLLSGNLRDGAAGLEAIQRHGGKVIVQAPSDALVPSMPRNALQHVRAHCILPSDEIAAALVRFVLDPLRPWPYSRSRRSRYEQKVVPPVR